MPDSLPKPVRDLASLLFAEVMHDGADPAGAVERALAKLANRPGLRDAVRASAERVLVLLILSSLRVGPPAAFGTGGRPAAGSARPAPAPAVGPRRVNRRPPP